MIFLVNRYDIKTTLLIIVNAFIFVNIFLGKNENFTSFTFLKKLFVSIRDF